jgi:hypothetical protein
MKTHCVGLACLLMFGCGAPSMGAEPPAQQEEKQGENEKVERAVKEMGGSAYANCEWVDGYYVIFHGEKVTDATLERLKQFPQIKGLDLTGTRVTDAGLAHLKGFTQLLRLQLGKTAVTDAGLKHLKGLTTLEWLGLEGTSITDAGLDHLKGLKQLQSLDLRGSKITDAGLERLHGLSQLKSLSLGGTRVTDDGVGKLKKALPKCQINAAKPALKATAGRKNC